MTRLEERIAQCKRMARKATKSRDRLMYKLEADGLKGGRYPMFTDDRYAVYRNAYLLGLSDRATLLKLDGQ